MCSFQQKVISYAKDKPNPEGYDPYTGKKKKKTGNTNLQVPEVRFDKDLKAALINMFKGPKETNAYRSKGRYDDHVSSNREYQ